jgi:phage shock protein E
LVKRPSGIARMEWSFMDWKTVVLVMVAVGAWLTLKQLSLVSAAVARKCLQQDALLVDVRTAGEYRSGHLPGAVNIPLDDMPQTFPRRVGDKRQAVLVHCLSGTRSGIARRQLMRMGYENVFNLGSYGRAERIVNQARH